MISHQVSRHFNTFYSIIQAKFSRRVKTFQVAMLHIKTFQLAGVLSLWVALPLTRFNTGMNSFGQFINTFGQFIRLRTILLQWRLRLNEAALKCSPASFPS